MESFPYNLLTSIGSGGLYKISFLCDIYDVILDSLVADFIWYVIGNKYLVSFKTKKPMNH